TQLERALEQIAADTTTAAAQQVRADAETILACAVHLAEWVIAREVAHDPSIYLPVVEEVINDLPAAVPVTVTVHPTVHAQYAQFSHEHLAHNITIVTDPDMPP